MANMSEWASYSVRDSRSEEAEQHMEGDIERRFKVMFDCDLCDNLPRNP
jgi:hypothetical protein